MQDMYEIVDFGPGPQDQIVDFPFGGTEDQCSDWLTRNQMIRADGSKRFALQANPHHDSPKGIALQVITDFLRDERGDSVAKAYANELLARLEVAGLL